MPRETQDLDDLADAVLDGSAVDWTGAESTADDQVRPLIRQLRLVSALANVHRDRPVRPWLHLRLLEPISRGSFGVVYRAHDTRLDREVALKLIPTDKHGDAQASSYIHEGRLLARVRHPNVVTIHGAERVGDEIGLWMEFVRGRTLAQLVQERGRFSLDDAIRSGIELCRALAAVHAAGVLHRDVKAHNVMRADDGRIVLMDFGTGREASDASAPDIAGTPLYISPEVLRGEPATPQSDIYAVGVLLYYLLTGDYPVGGTTLTDVRQAHQRGVTVDLHSVRRDLPTRAVQAIERALSPRPEERHASAAAFESELRRIAPRRSRKWLLATAAGVAAVAVLALWRLTPGEPLPPRALAPDERPVIAVLPFRNDSSEAGSDLFADGLTDEIIRNLAVIDGLDVRSSSSSFAWKSRPRDIAEIRRQLGVNLVLEGSVFRAGNRLRIQSQLVLTATDVAIWADKFDRELDDIFAIQDSISIAIVDALRLTLGRGQRRYDTTPKLYERYLIARGILARKDPSEVQRAVGLFEEVAAADPAFAPAYAGLASAAAARAYVYPSVVDAIAPDVAHATIRPAAARAIALDPLLAEAHAAMGIVHAADRNWTAAEASFHRALALDRSRTEVHTEFVRSTLWPQGKLKESAALLQEAAANDPDWPSALRLLARMQLQLGLPNEALATLRRQGRIDPTDDSALVRIQAHVQADRALQVISELRILLRQGESDLGLLGQLGYAYAISGRRQEAGAIAARIVDYPGRQALIYGALGDADRAFEALGRLAESNPRRAATYLTYPELRSLQDDPRMVVLRRKLGVPDPAPGR